MTLPPLTARLPQSTVPPSPCHLGAHVTLAPPSFYGGHCHPDAKSGASLTQAPMVTLVFIVSLMPSVTLPPTFTLTTIIGAYRHPASIVSTHPFHPDFQCHPNARCHPGVPLNRVPIVSLPSTVTLAHNSPCNSLSHWHSVSPWRPSLPIARCHHDACDPDSQYYPGTDCHLSGPRHPDVYCHLFPRFPESPWRLLSP